MFVCVKKKTMIITPFYKDLQKTPNVIVYISEKKNQKSFVDIKKTGSQFDPKLLIEILNL